MFRSAKMIRKSKVSGFEIKSYCCPTHKRHIIDATLALHSVMFRPITLAAWLLLGH